MSGAGGAGAILSVVCILAHGDVSYFRFHNVPVQESIIFNNAAGILVSAVCPVIHLCSLV